MLLAYGWHERVTAESLRPWPWAGPVAWTIAGGLAMGLALLAMGGLALIVIPIILLHQYYLQAARRRRPRPGRGRGAGGSPGGTRRAGSTPCWPWRSRWRVALPWFVLMVRTHGWPAIAAPADPPERLLLDRGLSLPAGLIELAPVTLPLGLFGAVRAIRLALVDESNTRESVGGSLWVIWLAVAALAAGGLAAAGRRAPSTSSCWCR